eukprot:m.242143 g.242143  ORF g.242143 m.242143 type:complete len:345 (-) comp30239_c0_seq1:39-1073(-)
MIDSSCKKDMKNQNQNDNNSSSRVDVVDPIVVPQWVHFVSGGVGACISASVTCPLEVVKTRMQSSMYNYSSVRTGSWAISATGSALKHTFKTEGVLSLWKGLGPMLLGVIPARSIYFFGYNFMKERSRVWNNGKDDWRTHLLSAGSAALCSTTIVNPLWVVKTRVQLARSQYAVQAVNSSGVETVSAATSIPTSSVAIAKKILADEGPLGFMRGLSASVAGVLETAIQFAIYEALKKEFVDEESKWLGLQIPVVSAVAKVIAIAISYPHEVVRTRLREPPVSGVRIYTSFFQTLKFVAEREGVSSLYRGMTTHMLRSVPNAAILILTYELTVRTYKNFVRENEV